MTVLARKLGGKFLGDLVTDQLDFSQLPRRLPGVKHSLLPLRRTIAAALKLREVAYPSLYADAA
jgi:hypothetical protein